MSLSDLLLSLRERGTCDRRLFDRLAQSDMPERRTHERPSGQERRFARA